MTAADGRALSVECALAREPDYEEVHAWCRQARDVPLPHSRNVLLVARCRCPCHGPGDGPAGPDPSDRAGTGVRSGGSVTGR
jgi:hypothetical protein